VKMYWSTKLINIHAAIANDSFDSLIINLAILYDVSIYLLSHRSLHEIGSSKVIMLHGVTSNQISCSPKAIFAINSNCSFCNFGKLNSHSWKML
jgi:hypothetical protein